APQERIHLCQKCAGVQTCRRHDEAPESIRSLFVRHSATMTTDARYKLVVGTVAFIVALPVLGALGTFFLLLIGYYQSPSFDTPFQQAHERAVTTFVESEGFGFSRFRRHDLWRE